MSAQRKLFVFCFHLILIRYACKIFYREDPRCTFASQLITTFETNLETIQVAKFLVKCVPTHPRLSSNFWTQLIPNANMVLPDIRPSNQCCRGALSILLKVDRPKETTTALLVAATRNSISRQPQQPQGIRTTSESIDCEIMDTLPSLVDKTEYTIYVGCGDTRCSPLMAATPKQKKRRVRFSGVVQERTVASLINAVEHKQNLWYTRFDRQVTLLKANWTAQNLSSGQHVETAHQTGRGLEYHHAETKARKLANIDLARSAVLEEQKRQRNEQRLRIPSPAVASQVPPPPATSTSALDERIAAVYQQATVHSRHEAFLRGREDAKAVHSVWKSSGNNQANNIIIHSRQLNNQQMPSAGEEMPPGSQSQDNGPTSRCCVDDIVVPTPAPFVALQPWWAPQQLASANALTGKASTIAPTTSLTRKPRSLLMSKSFPMPATRCLIPRVSPLTHPPLLSSSSTRTAT